MKNKITNIFLIFSLSLSLLLLNQSDCQAKGEKSPPLAPPSSFSISLPDLLLHFKIFVIVDVFQKILSEKESNRESIRFTDVELEILTKDAIAQKAMFKGETKLEIHVSHGHLFIRLDQLYFECFQLEVIPGLFEFKTNKVSKEDFLTYYQDQGS